MILLSALFACSAYVVEKSDTASTGPVDDDCQATFWSTAIFVYDEEGAVPVNPDVTYVLDGGEAQDAVCSHLTEDSRCALWHAGFEEAGTFVITVEASGYTSETKTVDVGLSEDGCNVEPVWVDFALEQGIE